MAEQQSGGPGAYKEDRDGHADLISVSLPPERRRPAGRESWGGGGHISKGPGGVSAGE